MEDSRDALWLLLNVLQLLSNQMDTPFNHRREGTSSSRSHMTVRRDALGHAGQHFRPSTICLKSFYTGSDKASARKQQPLTGSLDQGPWQDPQP